LDQLADLLGQLYKAEDPAEVQELTSAYHHNEISTIVSNDDLLQFSENAVLSPPTTTDNAIQLSDTAVLISDDLHTIPITSRDTVTSSPEDMEVQDEQVNAVLEETEGRTGDTVILIPEDSTTATTTCSKERQGIYETYSVT